METGPVHYSMCMKESSIFQPDIIRFQVFLTPLFDVMEIVLLWNSKVKTQFSFIGMFIAIVKCYTL